jgi:trk system potassium uptake protein TrkH
MNIALTLRTLGALLLFLAAALLVPLACALFYGDGTAGAFLLSAAICAACGGGCYRSFHSKGDLSVREGFAIVTFGWLAFALFGALPYVISGGIPAYVDAFFEAMSGFTTTGSTILTDIEALPPSLLFWRSFTQWLGGMGIIVLSLAILPMLGVGGMQLFKAEVPGPTADRLTPRIQDTAKLLWGVYLLLSIIELGLLMAGNMNFFDAINHTFTTMATGGFSTRNASVAAYHSAYIDGVITLFMFLAGVNFTLHYLALRGRPLDFWRNEEFRFYLWLTLGATVLLTLFNLAGPYAGIGDSLRYSAFQVVSIMTTTGYATADYERWHVFCQYLLVACMFVGGCAGSTGGGMKVARVLLLFKHAHVQLFRLIHPRAVRLVKLGERPVDKEVMQSILGFFALYMGIFVSASLVMAALGMDLVSAGSAVVTALGNVGPGLGTVGPVQHFAYVPTVGKLVLALCMLLGRLELFTVLVLFIPSFWRK